MLIDIILGTLISLGGGSVLVYAAVGEAKIVIADRAAPEQIKAAVQADLFEVKQQKIAIEAKTHLTPEDLAFLRDHGWTPEPDATPAIEAPKSIPRVTATHINKTKPTVIRTLDGRDIYVLEEDM